MNQCHFLGNLTRDPELKELGEGKKVVNFGLAVNRRYKKNSENASETAFLDLEAWDTGAQVISDHLKKGDPVIVHCSIKQETWNDSATGQKRTRLKFRVNQFEFVPGSRRNRDEAPESNGGGEAEPAPAAVGGGGEEDNIPF